MTLLGMAVFSISCALIEQILIVPDQLFRWHFKQPVLENMKGAGELVIEYDLPPGTDMMRKAIGAGNVWAGVVL